MKPSPLLDQFCRRALFALLGLGGPAAAQDSTYELPKYVTYSEQVANQTPVAAVAMPVSGLRFEPRVEVQARNMAEAQADVTIRGGIFENTGFKLGASALFDPQTGHYLAELPVAPAMLLSPLVLTGADNALAGFNAGVGSVAYGWRPIVQRGEASAAVGDYATDRQSLYQGFVFPGGGGGPVMAADFELARSESDGSVPHGDHNFKRATGRFQVRDAQSQTDFFAGVQSKFFGWPDLYTPFGVNETEDLHTQLYAFNHRVQTAPDGYWELGAYYRRNYDDYEFNRFVPGQFNPYQHTTIVRSLAVDGHEAYAGFAVSYNAQVMHDSLRSTALVHGRFNYRSYLKHGPVPELETESPLGKFKLRAGATYDYTNRDGSAVSPVLAADLYRPAGQRLYVQYSETTQVPTYTALNSSATSGLFRGNPNLGRETSRDLELGAAGKAAGWTVETALFYRWDDRLVDWTFKRGVTARSANAVNIGTAGLEVVATRKTPHYDLILGYTCLDKNADYGAAAVDASFYALNYARHRLTAAVIARLGGGCELRVDNEYRVQEKNLLRVTGGNAAWRTSAGFYFLPARWPGVEFSLLVDNLWNNSFQEIPAVPAARRQTSLGAAWRW